MPAGVDLAGPAQGDVGEVVGEGAPQAAAAEGCAAADGRYERGEDPVQAAGGGRAEPVGVGDERAGPAGVGVVGEDGDGGVVEAHALDAGPVGESEVQGVGREHERPALGEQRDHGELGERAGDAVGDERTGVLAGTVARLAGATSAGVDQPTAGSDPGGTPDGEDLVAWVQWLVTRYELDNIPEWWAQHGALVEELDALRIGWLSSMGRGQGGIAAMQWHDYFGRTLVRIDRRWRSRNCEDTHRPTTLPTWATDEPGTLEVPDVHAGRYHP